MSVLYLMHKKLFIPIFPLSILPLPGELVPLHIFEERYRQLLTDIEISGGLFGLFYVAEDNHQRFGSIVKLESVDKRYNTGESDIVVKCVGTFIMDRYLKNYEDKLYAGGEVIKMEDNENALIIAELEVEFREYQSSLKSKLKNSDHCSLDDIANSLQMDNQDRLSYLSLLTPIKKNRFLLGRLKFKKFIVEQEIKYKNSFILN